MEAVKGVCLLFSGLGVFLLGMNLISANLTKAAGGKVGMLIGKMGKNPLAGIGLGAGATVLLESSSATTVILVGLVNAGILTLAQACAVIMGSNIGATFTVLILSVNALPLSCILSVLSLIGIAFVLGSKKEKFRCLGYIISGIGLIFIGMESMSGAVGGLRESAWMSAALSRSTAPILLLAMGVGFSALVQSSSAVSALAIALAEGGVMEPIATFYVVLGANVGTCVTALIAAIGGSVNGKRTALLHVMFNVIGAILFYPLLRVFGVGATEALKGKLSPSVQIAYFHVLFNLATALLLLPFLKKMVALSERLLPENGAGGVKEEKRLAKASFFGYNRRKETDDGKDTEFYGGSHTPQAGGVRIAQGSGGKRRAHDL